MIDFLTRNALARWIGQAYRHVQAAVLRFLRENDEGSLILKLFMGAYTVGLTLVFVNTIFDYQEASKTINESDDAGSLNHLPSVIPMIFQGLGVVLALGGFLVSFLVNEKISLARRRILAVLILSVAAIAALSSWLPTDLIATREAIMGKVPSGETPSIPAYLGMLGLISLLILSVPVATFFYFRLGLMDRYVVHQFLSPFLFCLASFMAIFVLGDFTENADLFSKLSFGGVVKYYSVQMPHVILFVMPIAVLLSGLFAMGRMSKTNELISMISAGRSVQRILTPLIVTGAYISLIALAFKYEWAPAAIGYKDAVKETIQREQSAGNQAKGKKNKAQNELWAQRGAMYVNEVDRRSWFIGRVPFKLSDDMAEVIITELDENDQPSRIWFARRARWVWDSKPPKWILTRVRIFTYDNNHVPTVESKARLELTQWAETPWKVLSSSQEADHLGIPGLTMYLNANRDHDDLSLAPYRTNWWMVFAEPLACLAMILVAAPLGIVYSRRGGMSGVTGAIGVFALMYVMRGTFIAIGHSGRLPPFVAAWVTNITIAIIGIVLIWIRARNREFPSPITFVKSLFRRLLPSSSAH